MPGAADLVTLVEAKDYLGTTTSVGDTRLQALISACSLAILQKISRTSVLPKAYVETRDGNPRGIMLRNWPVQSVQSVTVRRHGFGDSAGVALLPALTGQVGYVIDDPDDAPAGAPQFLKTPWGGMEAGTDNVTIAYTAGYQVTGEAWNLPTYTNPSIPQTITVAQPYGAWGSDAGVTYANGTALRAVAAGAEALGAYSVASGAYIFAAADGGASVLISYGYIPADLANACLEWVADRLAYAERRGVNSKTLGGQETVSYRVTSVPAFVTEMIANYMNVVPIT